MKAFALRPGMWLRTDHGTGILRDVTKDELGNMLLDVMLTDEKGHNKVMVLVEPMTVRQAKLSEIPSARLHNDVERLNAQGYV
jgi:hypothetical protein